MAGRFRADVLFLKDHARRKVGGRAANEAGLGRGRASGSGKSVKESQGRRREEAHGAALSEDMGRVRGRNLKKSKRSKQ